MSAQKNKGVVLASSGIVVGNDRHNVLKTKLFIALMVVIVVVAIIAAATKAIVHHYYNSSKMAVKDTPKAQQRSLEQQTVALSLRGEYRQATQLLNAQISKTADPTNKGALYEQEANLAYENKDYFSGLNAAQMAEKLHPTADSASLVAKNAELLGNQSVAVKYYKLELERLSRPITPSDRANQNDLKIKISSLGG